MASYNSSVAPIEIKKVKEEIESIADRLEILDKDFRYDPLYGVAMLKVSFNLRPQRWAGFDDILQDTMQGLDVNKKDLDRFIADHHDHLQQACKEIGI